MAAKLPFKYTGAVVLGSNISGTFTSVVFILTKLYTSSVQTAAIYYFIGAIFILLACFDTYFALPLNVSHLNIFQAEQCIDYFPIHTEVLSISWTYAWERGGKGSKVGCIIRSPTILVYIQTSIPTIVQRLLHIFHYTQLVPSYTSRFVDIFARK